MGCGSSTSVDAVESKYRAQSPKRRHSPPPTAFQPIEGMFTIVHGVHAGIVDMTPFVDFVRVSLDDSSKQSTRSDPLSTSETLQGSPAAALARRRQHPDEREPNAQMSQAGSGKHDLTAVFMENKYNGFIQHQRQLFDALSLAHQMQVLEVHNFFLWQYQFSQLLAKGESSRRDLLIAAEADLFGRIVTELHALRRQHEAQTVAALEEQEAKMRAAIAVAAAMRASAFATSGVQLHATARKDIARRLCPVDVVCGSSRTKLHRTTGDGDQSDSPSTMPAPLDAEDEKVLEESGGKSALMARLQQGPGDIDGAGTPLSKMPTSPRTKDAMFSTASIPEQLMRSTSDTSVDNARDRRHSTASQSSYAQDIEDMLCHNGVTFGGAAGTSQASPKQPQDAGAGSPLKPSLSLLASLSIAQTASGSARDPASPLKMRRNSDVSLPPSPKHSGDAAVITVVGSSDSGSDLEGDELLATESEMFVHDAKTLMKSPTSPQVISTDSTAKPPQEIVAGFLTPRAQQGILGMLPDSPGNSAGPGLFTVLEKAPGASQSQSLSQGNAAGARKRSDNASEASPSQSFAKASIGTSPGQPGLAIVDLNAPVSPLIRRSHGAHGSAFSPLRRASRSMSGHGSLSGSVEIRARFSSPSSPNREAVANNASNLAAGRRSVSFANAEDRFAKQSTSTTHSGRSSPMVSSAAASHPAFSGATRSPTTLAVPPVRRGRGLSEDDVLALHLSSANDGSVKRPLDDEDGSVSSESLPSSVSVTPCTEGLVPPAGHASSEVSDALADFDGVSPLEQYEARNSDTRSVRSKSPQIPLPRRHRRSDESMAGKQRSLDYTVTTVDGDDVANLARAMWGVETAEAEAIARSLNTTHRPLHKRHVSFESALPPTIVNSGDLFSSLLHIAQRAAVPKEIMLQLRHLLAAQRKDQITLLDNVETNASIGAFGIPTPTNIDSAASGTAVVKMPSLQDPPAVPNPAVPTEQRSAAPPLLPPAQRGPVLGLPVTLAEPEYNMFEVRLDEDDAIAPPRPGLNGMSTSDLLMALPVQLQKLLTTLVPGVARAVELAEETAPVTHPDLLSDVRTLRLTNASDSDGTANGDSSPAHSDTPFSSPDNHRSGRKDKKSDSRRRRKLWRRFWKPQGEPVVTGLTLFATAAEAADDVAQPAHHVDPTDAAKVSEMKTASLLSPHKHVRLFNTGSPSTPGSATPTLPSPETIRDTNDESSATAVPPPVQDAVKKPSFNFLNVGPSIPLDSLSVAVPMYSKQAWSLQTVDGARYYYNDTHDAVLTCIVELSYDVKLFVNTGLTAGGSKSGMSSRVISGTSLTSLPDEAVAAKQKLIIAAGGVQVPLLAIPLSDAQLLGADAEAGKIFYKTTVLPGETKGLMSALVKPSTNCTFTITLRPLSAHDVALDAGRAFHELSILRLHMERSIKIAGEPDKQGKRMSIGCFEQDSEEAEPANADTAARDWRDGVTAVKCATFKTIFIDLRFPPNDAALGALCMLPPATSTAMDCSPRGLHGPNDSLASASDAHNHRRDVAGETPRNDDALAQCGPVFTPSGFTSDALLSAAVKRLLCTHPPTPTQSPREPKSRYAFVPKPKSLLLPAIEPLMTMAWRCPRQILPPALAHRATAVVAVDPTDVALPCDALGLGDEGLSGAAARCGMIAAAEFPSLVAQCFPNSATTATHSRALFSSIACDIALQPHGPLNAAAPPEISSTATAAMCTVLAAVARQPLLAGADDAKGGQAHAAGPRLSWSTLGGSTTSMLLHGDLTQSGLRFDADTPSSTSVEPKPRTDLFASPASFAAATSVDLDDIAPPTFQVPRVVESDDNPLSIPRPLGGCADMVSGPIESSTRAHVLRLCIGGWWRDITVDEFFPCLGSTLVSLRTRGLPYELWPALIEKALAKAVGGYGHLLKHFPLSAVLAAPGTITNTLLVPVSAAFEKKREAFSKIAANPAMLRCPSLPTNNAALALAGVESAAVLSAITGLPYAAVATLPSANANKTSDAAAAADATFGSWAAALSRALQWSSAGNVALLATPDFTSTRSDEASRSGVRRVSGHNASRSSSASRAGSTPSRKAGPGMKPPQHPSHPLSVDGRASDRNPPEELPPRHAFTVLDCDPTGIKIRDAAAHRPAPSSPLSTPTTSMATADTSVTTPFGAGAPSLPSTAPAGASNDHLPPSGPTGSADGTKWMSMASAESQFASAAVAAGCAGWDEVRVKVRLGPSPVGSAVLQFTTHEPVEAVVALWQTPQDSGHWSTVPMAAFVFSEDVGYGCESPAPQTAIGAQTSLALPPTVPLPRMSSRSTLNKTPRDQRSAVSFVQGATTTAAEDRDSGAPNPQLLSANYTPNASTSDAPSSTPTAPAPLDDTSPLVQLKKTSSTLSASSRNVMMTSVNLENATGVGGGPIAGVTQTVPASLTAEDEGSNPLRRTVSRLSESASPRPSPRPSPAGSPSSSTTQSPAMGPAVPQGSAPSSARSSSTAGGQQSPGGRGSFTRSPNHGPVVPSPLRRVASSDPGAMRAGVRPPILQMRLAAVTSSDPTLLMTCDCAAADSRSSGRSSTFTRPTDGPKRDAQLANSLTEMPVKPTRGPAKQPPGLPRFQSRITKDSPKTSFKELPPEAKDMAGDGSPSASNNRSQPPASPLKPKTVRVFDAPEVEQEGSLRGPMRSRESRGGGTPLAIEVALSNSSDGDDGSAPSPEVLMANKLVGHTSRGECVFTPPTLLRAGTHLVIPTVPEQGLRAVDSVLVLFTKKPLASVIDAIDGFSPPSQSPNASLTTPPAAKAGTGPSRSPSLSPAQSPAPTPAAVHLKRISPHHPLASASTSLASSYLSHMLYRRLEAKEKARYEAALADRGLSKAPRSSERLRSLINLSTHDSDGEGEGDEKSAGAVRPQLSFPPDEERELRASLGREYTRVKEERRRQERALAPLKFTFSSALSATAHRWQRRDPKTGALVTGTAPTIPVE